MSRYLEPEDEGKWRRYLVAAAIVLVFLSGGYGVFRVINGDATPKKRIVEVMALKLVPPPPLPPPKEEPPPPPPKMVEQKIEPPVDKPDDKPKDEAPPPDAPLALDAQAGPGGDAFGLASKPGGRDITLGGGTGGRGGGGNLFGRYAALMQDQIGRRLREDEKLNTMKFRATIRVWLTGAGKVDRVQVMRTTGDTQLDSLIEQELGAMPTLPEAPPREMPQPVIVRIAAAPGVG